MVLSIHSLQASRAEIVPRPRLGRGGRTLRIVDLDDLERRYTAHVLEVTTWLAREHGYRPTYFLREVDELGAPGAARQVIGANAATTTEGFTRLWELRLLNSSVEFDAQLPWWAPLFSDSQRAVARERLISHRFVDLDRAVADTTPPSWYQPPGGPVAP